MSTLKRKYGIATGISMVVGVVIGSGVFFKAPKVLENTGGKLSTALLAWLISGAIMIISAFCFSIMANSIQKVNGVVDYVEAASNEKMGYSLAWYFATIYYPILVATLGFVSMIYFYTLIGASGVLSTWHFWVATSLLIVSSFVLNTVAPKIAGYFQVSTTIIKLIPIFVIAIIGTIFGLLNGNLDTAFSSVAVNATNNFGSAILATIFAYEGWVVATSINAELRNSKKNLPIALVLGSVIVVASYILYYLGLSSLVPDTADLISFGDNGPFEALKVLFGIGGKVVFNLFVFISCLGTLNGLTMACSRGFFSIAYRGRGPLVNKVRKIHPRFNTSVASSAVGLGLSMIFVALWIITFNTKFNFLSSMDELSIAFVYSSYIIIYIWLIKNRKDLKFVSRFVMPILAIISAVFFVFTATGLFSFVLTKNTNGILNFLVFGGIVLISAIFGVLFFKKKDDLVSIVSHE